MNYKVIIWGMGDNYEKLLNQILFEIYKGTIHVEAIVCNEKDAFCKKRDGFPVVGKKEIMNLDFDFAIVTSTKYFAEIIKEAREMNIPEWKIIDGTVLGIPHFDFGRYASLKKNPVTIISDDCWAAYAYNYLKLSHTTPFINILILKEEYVKILKNPEYYLKSELKMLRDGNISEGIYPIGCLGEDEKTVRLEFVHEINFEEAKEHWDRRVARVNYDNIFVKMGLEKTEIEDKSWLDIFNAVKYKKVLFGYEVEGADDNFYSPRFLWARLKSGVGIKWYRYWEYQREFSRYDIDLLKLLNGEEGYSRY